MNGTISKPRPKALPVRLLPDKHRADTWACPSTSTAGVTYTLGVEDGGGTWCTCPGWKHHGHCKHEKVLERKLWRAQKRMERL